MLVALKNKKIQKIIVIAVLLFFGVAWRVYDCFKFDIWLDEACSLHTAQGSLSQTWNKAINFEIQPPVYFLLLNLWTKISTTVEFARLLSVVLSIFCIFFIYRTWSYLFGDRFYWLIPAVFLFHSFHLWASSEARGYAALIFFTTASNYYFIKIIFSNGEKPPSLGKFIFYFIWSALGIFTNYFCGFLLFAHFLASCFWFERRKFWRLQFCYLIIGVVLLLWLPILQTQLSLMLGPDPTSELQAKMEPKTLSEFSQFIRPIYWVAKFIIFMPTLSFTGKLVTCILFALFLSAILVAKTTFGKRKTSREELLLLLISTIPLSSIIAFSIFFPHVGSVRYYAIAYSSLIMFILSLLTNNSSHDLVKKINLAIIFLFLVVSIAQELKFSKSNWKKLSEHVELHEKRGDAIFFFNSIYYQLPFSYHYNGSNPIYNIPHDSNFATHAFLDKAIQNERQLHKFFEKRTPGSGRIWLIGRQDLFKSEINSVVNSSGLLRKYLNKKYDLIKEIQFENTAIVFLFQSKILILNKKNCN